MNVKKASLVTAAIALGGFILLAPTVVFIASAIAIATTPALTTLGLGWLANAGIGIVAGFCVGRVARIACNLTLGGIAKSVYKAVGFTPQNLTKLQIKLETLAREQEEAAATPLPKAVADGFNAPAAKADASVVPVATPAPVAPAKKGPKGPAA